MPTVYNKVTAGGSTLIDLSQDTVTSASDIVSGKVGHLADGTQVTGTGSGGNDFVVSLSKNNQTGYWEPDKTWSEVSAAIADNKTFVFCIAGMTANSEVAVDGVVLNGHLVYVVYETLQDQSNNYYANEFWYSFDSTGVTQDYVYTYYDTSNADATAADILSGKTAFNSSGSVSGAIQTKTSSDLTASGATVSVPAGYYASAASKAVSSGSASTPATTITANPSISVNSSGLITATASASQSVTPTVSAGYVSSGTAGTVTVSGSNTSQLTTQAAQTIHPSTSDQTISSGKYLTGAQTIKAVTLSNLTADNIKSGVTVTVGDSTDSDCVASVTGTYSGGSSKNMQAYIGYATRKATTYGATSVTLTVAKTGTYTISWIAWRSSSQGTMGTNLHIGSTAETANHQTFTGTYGQCITLSNQSLTQGTVLTLYAVSGSNTRTIYVGNLIIEEEE